MSRNKMNAPQAHEEQLMNLRSVYCRLTGPMKPKTFADLIRIANINGYYDAADHVQHKAESGITDLNEMMEW